MEAAAGRRDDDLLARRERGARPVAARRARGRAAGPGRRGGARQPARRAARRRDRRGDDGGHQLVVLQHRARQQRADLRRRDAVGDPRVPRRAAAAGALARGRGRPDATRGVAVHRPLRPLAVAHAPGVGARAGLRARRPRRALVRAGRDRRRRRARRVGGRPRPGQRGRGVERRRPRPAGPDRLRPHGHVAGAAGGARGGGDRRPRRAVPGAQRDRVGAARRGHDAGRLHRQSPLQRARRGDLLRARGRRRRALLPPARRRSRALAAAADRLRGDRRRVPDRPGQARPPARRARPPRRPPRAAQRDRRPRRGRRRRSGPAEPSGRSRR